MHARDVSPDREDRATGRTLLSSWLSRLHFGAYDNVLIPAYAGLGLLVGLASRAIPACVAATHQPFVRLAVAVLCVGQLVALRYPVDEQLPTLHDAELGRDLGSQIAGVGGDVLVPFHSFVPTPTGPVMHAHSWAVYDVLRSGDAETMAQLTTDIKSAFGRRQFRMIVLDRIVPWMEPELDASYRRSGPVFATDGLWTRSGYHTRPRWLYAPR